MHTRNPCTGRFEGTFAAAQLAVSSLNASVCVLAYLPLTRPVFFSSALQQRGVIQNKEVTPEFRHRSWLWLHWYCLGYWMFFAKVHQLRLLLSWTQYFSVFKWRCLLCLLPIPSLFCMLAELQGKWCSKIPCIGFLLFLGAFQFSCMLVCSWVCLPNSNTKSHVPCYHSGWALMEYLFHFPDYPILFWTISTLSVLVVIVSTD